MLVSNTALITLLPGVPCAPNLAHGFDDFLLGHRRLSRTKLHLVNNREYPLPSAFSSTGRLRRKRDAALEHVGLQLVAVLHVELFPDFLRQRDPQLAIANMGSRHRALHRVHMGMSISCARKTAMKARLSGVILAALARLPAPLRVAAI